MKGLVDFKQQSPPARRTSRLKSFKNEIIELYNEGYKVEQIQDFLAQNDIHVTVDAINKFKRNLNAQNFPLKNPSSYIGSAKKSQTEPKVANEPNDSKALNALMQKMQKKNKEIEE